MRILVAGNTGQVAQALAECAAHGSGLTLRSLGRDTMDIRDKPAVVRAVDAERPDIVVNAAAYTAVDKAESDEDAVFAVNETGARNLAEASASAGIPVIHLSTDYVFDGTKPDPYTEDDPVAPAGAYGRSKLAGEVAVGEANPQHIIFRTAWIHSATGHNFVKTMLRLAADRDALNVVDDQRGNPSYAPHIADAILTVARGLKADGASAAWGLYHLAGTGATTWCGLAREVFARSRALGGDYADVNPITTADYPTPAQRPANSQLDCGKLARTFGIEMPSWQDGVAECVSRLVTREA
ncbi:dTDP-4-dehydrorhamnose reductase [Methyloceanibacter sp. wino2]|uniref:dTDP-4-dehydrorhamnose reductase n=1 Tax=Methyloceanibacter sp. wino2 TaxID=2170729 RepID=UPI000D3E4CD6|nr:dTDP-4-dehydrorhamnose reductase [Methyloceanibacter sp. wino2]